MQIQDVQRDAAPGIRKDDKQNGSLETYHNELCGLIKDPPPQLEGCRRREEVCDLGVKVARLRVGGAGRKVRPNHHQNGTCWTA